MRGLTHFYEFDPMGNVVRAEDVGSNTLGSWNYDAYGSRTGSAPVGPYLYGGQWGYYTDWNTSTGLILCTHRYYDPGLGRWLTRDPIGYEGGVNLYGYVEGNPVSFTDPMGEEATVIGGARTGAKIGMRWGPVGAVVGAVAGAAIVATVAYVCLDDPKPCPPCAPPMPPVGSIGYQLHTTHSHFPINGPHVHLFRCHQNPKTCDCFWNEISGRAGVTSPPPPLGAYPVPTTRTGR